MKIVGGIVMGAFRG